MKSLCLGLIFSHKLLCFPIRNTSGFASRKASVSACRFEDQDFNQDLRHVRLKTLAHGVGPLQEHNNAGVFRHPPKRKSCSSPLEMATGAFAFGLGIISMATAEIVRWLVHEQDPRVAQSPRRPLAKCPQWQIKSTGQLERTHAHKHRHTRSLGKMWA